MAKASVLAVSISISGEGVDPDEVSETLGAEPDRSHRVGDVLSAESSARRRTGLWCITTQASAADEVLLADHVAALLGRVNMDTGIWRQLAGRHNTRVSIGWFMGDGNEALRVDAATLDELARRGLLLDIEVYAPPADE